MARLGNSLNPIVPKLSWIMEEAIFVEEGGLQHCDRDTLTASQVFGAFLHYPQNTPKS